MYVQHLQTTFWRGGGETLVGQRVLLYKDDVRPTPADHLPFGEEGGGETLVGQRVFLYKDDVQHPLTAF